MRGINKYGKKGSNTDSISNCEENIEKHNTTLKKQ